MKRTSHIQTQSHVFELAQIFARIKASNDSIRYVMGGNVTIEVAGRTIADMSAESALETGLEAILFIAILEAISSAKGGVAA